MSAIMMDSSEYKNNWTIGQMHRNRSLYASTSNVCVFKST